MIDRRRRELLRTGFSALMVGIAGCSQMRNMYQDTQSEEQNPSTPSTDTPENTATNTESQTTEPRPEIGSWPTFRYNNANTGYNPNSPEFGINSGSMQVKWTSPKLGGDPGAVVNDGRIFTSSTDGFHVLDQNGEILNHMKGRQGNSALAYEDGYLYGVYDDNRLAILSGVDNDATTHAATYSQRGTVYHPAPTESNVVVTQELGMVFAYGKSSDEEKWRVPFSDISNEDDRANSAPAVAEGSVYVVTRRGHVASIGLANGEIEWTKDTGANNLETSPVVQNGVVYVVSTNLLALNPESGEILWESENTTDLLGGVSPAITQNYIYHPDGNGLNALSLEDGSIEWTFETNTSPEGPITDGEIVYYLSGESTPDYHRTIHALNADDGTELGSLKKLNEPGDDFTQSVFRGLSAIAGGVLYVNGFNKIHAVTAG